MRWGTFKYNNKIEESLVYIMVLEGESEIGIGVGKISQTWEIEPTMIDADFLVKGKFIQINKITSETAWR